MDSSIPPFKCGPDVGQCDRSGFVAVVRIDAAVTDGDPGAAVTVRAEVRPNAAGLGLHGFSGPLASSIWSCR